MKILVISDSHGCEERVLELVDREKPRVVLHLGDCVRDVRELRMLPDLELCCVRGNCDPASAEVSRRVLELGGQRIFMAHGHEYGVKLSYAKIVNAACCADCTLLLFGHTHLPFYTFGSGLHIMNPGALRDGCFGIVELFEGGINCRLEKI